MHRSLSFVVSWLVALGCAAVAAAQDAADRPGGTGRAAARRELVEQLGDASYAVRDAAAKELTRLGPAAKGVLTEALSDPDPEIRSRARWILSRMPEEVEIEDAGDRSASPAPTAAQRELVQRLGDPSFFIREQAAEELASQGVACKAALAEALKDPDFEVRWRARAVLSRVVHEEFEARLAAFVADVGGSEEHRLPGWKRFRELVGDRREARETFAQMVRTERELLSAYETQSPETSDLFAARIAWLQSRIAGGSSDARAVPPQTLATLLLIGSDETLKDHSQGVSQLYPLLSNPAAVPSIAPAARPSALCTLLEKWATSAASSGSCYGMMLALKYDLKEVGLQQAKRFIEGGTTSPSTLQYAIIAVGRFGGEKDVGLLQPLLRNKTVCHTWSNPALKKNGTIQVQVRDAALAVLLHLTGKDPAKFGFKLLRENPETLYYVYTFGFIDDKEREAAHAKWAAESGADGG